MDLFSYQVDLEKASNGEPIVLDASAERCREIAAAFGLIALRAFTARFRVELTLGEIYKITGNLNAIVERESSSSGKPVTVSVDETFTVSLFASDERLAEYELSCPDDDADIAPNGKYDLGRLALEYLSMSIPDYPKLPEETLVGSGFVAFEREKNEPLTDLRKKLTEKHR